MAWTSSSPCPHVLHAHPQLLEVVKSRRHKLVLIHTECPYQDDEQLERAAYADLNLVNDPVSIARYRALGVPAEYVPHAYRPSLHKPGPADPGTRVGPGVRRDGVPVPDPTSSNAWVLTGSTCCWPGTGG